MVCCSAITTSGKMSAVGSAPSGSGARMPAAATRGTSTPSTTSTSHSPGCDCSIRDSAVPVPSYSFRFTLTSLAFSNGSISAGSVWSHQTRAFSSSVAEAEVAKRAAKATPAASVVRKVIVERPLGWSWRPWSPDHRAPAAKRDPHARRGPGRGRPRTRRRAAGRLSYCGAATAATTSTSNIMPGRASATTCRKVCGGSGMPSNVSLRQSRISSR